MNWLKREEIEKENNKIKKTSNEILKDKYLLGEYYSKLLKKSTFFTNYLRSIITYLEKILKTSLMV